VGMASIDIVHMQSFHGKKYLAFEMVSVIDLRKKHNLFKKNVRQFLLVHSRRLESLESPSK